MVWLQIGSLHRFPQIDRMHSGMPHVLRRTNLPHSLRLRFFPAQAEARNVVPPAGPDSLSGRAAAGRPRSSGQDAGW